MGAFDGLNFYQSCHNTNKVEEIASSSRPKTYYISFDHPTIKCGITGEHFDSKEEADLFFTEKEKLNLHPAKWYK